MATTGTRATCQKKTATFNDLEKKKSKHCYKE